MFRWTELDIFPENKQNPSERIPVYFSCPEFPQASGTDTQLWLTVFLKGGCYHAEWSAKSSELINSAAPYIWLKNKMISWLNMMIIYWFLKLELFWSPGLQKTEAK